MSQRAEVENEVFPFHGRGAEVENLAASGSGQVGVVLAEARMRLGLSLWGEEQKPTHPMQCDSKAVWHNHPADALPLFGRSIMLSTPSKAETPMS